MMFNVYLMFVVKSKTVGFTMFSCKKMILYIVLKKKIVEVWTTHEQSYFF